MTKTLKANDNNTATFSPYAESGVLLPLPPLDKAEGMDLDIYARFMRHVRLVPNARLDIKILSAIQFTSDMLDMNDVIVTKSLADMGLRAPRAALPAAYLDHADRTLLRDGWDVGGPCASTRAMQTHWDEIGEDNPASATHDYAAFIEPLNF